MNIDGTSSFTKDELRRSLRAALRSVPPPQREAWSGEIRDALKQKDFWVPPSGGVVAMFGGIGTEPDLLPLLPWLADRGVRAAFFAIAGEVMVPRLVENVGQLHAGQLSVLEPDASVCEPVAVEDLDVILLPGLAFGRLNGARLGRGKGHYDRVLDRLPAEKLRIGVCFHLQLHEAVPLEGHSQHVQALVTEQGWLRIAD